jgi:hypothetical protein
MNPPVSWWWAALAGLVTVGILPFVGQSMREDGRLRCRWDGRDIEAAYRVRTLDDTGAVSEFCDVGCARSWIARHPSLSRTILVTDEDSRESFDARKAFFVRSSIETNSVTRNRWHVFRSCDRAEQHARESRGRLMSGPDHPFSFPIEIP